jgi:signal transduction histidine kinase/CheY-like chemotaxis protein
MWDVATPIIVGGHHLVNLFCGQFFFDDEVIDYQVVRRRARRYGFDEKEYLAALDAVPRLSREAVNASMGFFARLAKVVSQLSYSTIKLARSSTQLSRVNAELAASVKELEAFTSSVSHDLRAPLRHISGFAKILSEEFKANLPEEAQQHLQRIDEGTRSMGMLVDDLLNLTRIGRCDLSLQVCGLRSLVDEVIRDLKPECEGREIDWKISSLPFVECDPGLVKQVFQNLLSNALKFTRPRTRALIDIGQQEEEGPPVIYLRDNGVGFSMKYADKLFGVFQRLHRQEDFEGTGVGLATHRPEAWRAHLGRSRIGQRGNVLFHTGAYGSIPRQSSSGSCGTRNKTRRQIEILLVEDNENDVELTLHALRREGLINQIQISRDGEEALDFLFCDGAYADRCFESQPKLVLLDLKLPEVDGMEVLRRLKSDPRTRTIPVV